MAIATVLWGGLEDQEKAVQVFRHLADGSLVAHPVAIVGSTPHSGQFSPQHLVALLAQLMSAEDEVEMIDVHEPLRDVLPKHIAGSPRGSRETGLEGIRVRPH